MLAKPIFTGRLKIEPFTPDDAKFIFELVNTAEWIKYIGDRNVRSESDAVAYLRNGPLKSYSENGFGLLKIVTLSNDRSIGACGLLKRKGLEHPDIGFALLPEYTGQGYAREAAEAILDHSFREMKLPRILAITLEENARSRNLLEHLGMRYIQNIWMPENDTEVELMLYRKDNPEND